MTLLAYLQTHGLTHAAFAEKIGVGVETARRYALGLRHPRPAIMRRIVDATDGAVQPSDFYEMDDGAAA